MTELYDLKFEWHISVEAETLEEAKETAPNVLREHIAQANLKTIDFTEVTE